MRFVYAIRDVAAGAIIGGLHVFPHDAVAVRFFGDLCGDPQTMIARHPKDHELIRIARVSDDDCMGTECPLDECGLSVVISGAAWVAAQQPAGPAGA